MSLTIPSIFTAVDRFSGPVNKMSNSASRFAEKTKNDFRTAGQTAFSLGRSTAMMGIAVAAPLALMVKSAVEFEDKMTDVQKTTGLSGVELKTFGSEILSMSKKTRTSIDDLVKIGEIGGQLGIAKKDLLSFTKASNMFNVALGKDFAGGVEEAITSVGKMATLFSDTKNLNISDSIMRTGSAINELGAMGAGTSSNITDFTLRMGALPDTLKGTAQQTIALGTYFEELGLNAQIASGGMTNLLLTAGENIGGFASQMKLSSIQAKELLAKDPTKFAKKFSDSFKGMRPDLLASKLKTLKVGTQETIKVIGALASEKIDPKTGVGRLAELIDASSNAFEKNNSLISEYDKKNNNSAANLDKLRNNIKSVSITLGNALLPVINSIVEKMMPFIDRISNWISRNKELTITILKVAGAIGGLLFTISAISMVVGTVQKAFALGKLAMLGYTNGLAMVKTALVFTKIATLELNGAMLLTPFGMVIVGLGAIAAASYLVYSAFTKQTTAQKLNSEVMDRALEKSIDQRVEVASLFATLRTAKTGTENYTNALARLEEIQPGIIKNYRLEKGALDDINKAEKNLIDNIMKRAIEEGRAELYKEKLKEGMQLQTQKATTFDKVLSVFNAGYNAEDLYKTQAKQKFQEASFLIQQEADAKMAADPSASKQQTLSEMLTGAIKSEIKLTFAGLPDGVTVNQDGMSTKPTTTSTTKK